MSKRLLFIDDQIKLWENALREELCNFGFDLKCTEDPATALKLIASYAPDVVLLDILYPEGYLGKPTLEKIKKKYPDLPVMMITSTMDKAEYKSEDYALADYRYSKEALTSGDFSDLASQLDMLIEKARTNKQKVEDYNGLIRFGFIVGQTKAMREVAEIVEKVANQDDTIIITGESGSGKELIAGAIHSNSSRKNKPFIKINCAALTETLLESELFGHEKGAFTDAGRRKDGCFSQAHEGSLFLDEVSEMSLAMQVKLLRVLQEKEFRRVGGEELIRVDVRVVAATNQNLEEMIKKGKFRDDLYYRLNVVQIYVPSLRERKEDIPVFFEYFIKKINKGSTLKILPILREDLKDILISYSWPGNIRELENIIKRAIALADENILQVDNFNDLVKKNADASGSSTDVIFIVNEIFKGILNWDYIKKEYGAKGSTRRELLYQIIQRWIQNHGKEPAAKDLAQLLSISETNMRRILSENGLRLRELKKDN